MLEIVYAENNEQFLWENSEQFYLIQKNRFYECSKQIWTYSKHDVQRTNFIKVEIDFINVEKQIHSLWNLNMKKHSDLALNLENTISLSVL